MSFLEIHHLSKAYGKKLTLYPTNLSVEHGELLCLLGPSGCGKTTLLNCIAGIIKPTHGTVHLSGRDITHERPERRHCGMVFQNYALFPNLTVAENIAYGLRGVQWPPQKRRERIIEMLTLVGLPDYAGRRITRCSGGEQQRIALARALAPSPDILLLDEPLSALDARVRVRLGEELRALQRRLDITTVMVTHDQQEALALADRIVVMAQGQVKQIGTPEQIWRAPTSLFVAHFVGDMNFLPRPDGAMCGIRYEEVQVLEATEFSLHAEDTRSARIEDIQYMGRMMRLRLLLQDYTTEIYADLLPGRQRFALHDLVAVRLPKTACRVWPSSSETKAQP